MRALHYQLEVFSTVVKMKRIYCKILHWTIAGLAFFLSAEITCRVQDWTQADVPLLATPDHDSDLIITDGGVRLGRPNGRFKKWQLNEYGFRGPNISIVPAEGCTRVLVLGASETFGLYESKDKEYPAQLRTLLGNSGCFEVVNTAIVGMTLNSMISYWTQWGSQFKPHFVVIYPSPMFYLNFVTRPVHPQPKVASPFLSALQRNAALHNSFQLRSRLLSHVQDYANVPDFIQQYRDQWTIRARTKGRPESWFLYKLPEEPLQWFVEDLESLAQAIEAQGAQPILLTHALRCKVPPDNQDLQELERGRVNTPRATPQVMVDFEHAAAERTRTLGQQHRWPVIDAAAVMNGTREYFADLVHFNDAGAGVIADLITRSILFLSLEERGGASTPARPWRAYEAETGGHSHALQ